MGHQLSEGFGIAGALLHRRVGWWLGSLAEWACLTRVGSHGSSLASPTSLRRGLGAEACGDVR